MKLAIIAITEQGVGLGQRLGGALPLLGDSPVLFIPSKHVTVLIDDGRVPIQRYEEKLSVLTAKLFGEYEGLIYLGATGVAVRCIAGHLTDKYHDPAIVVVDDAGRQVVSLLSGHEGGANRLAGRIATILNAQAVVTTASEANRPLIVGLGCRKGVIKEDLLAAIDLSLAQAGRRRDEVRLLASVDLKHNEVGLLRAAAEMGVPVRFVERQAIAVYGGEYSRSAYVAEAIGVSGVCEPAALISGRNARLILKKTKFPGVTVAIAEEQEYQEKRRRDSARPIGARHAAPIHQPITAGSREGSEKTGSGTQDRGNGQRGAVYVVGVGPGDLDQMSPAAQEAIRRSSVIVGYKSYVRLIEPLLDGKRVISSGMRHEIERGRVALDEARHGERVAVISSGDPGVYGMAGVVLELLGDDCAVDVEVIPGISASLAAAAALGAPLMHDFATISLSDLLTPWGDIVKRLDRAAEADFVIALYNPRSVGRPDLLAEALRIIGWHRAAETPVGIVRQARRGEQHVIIARLDQVDTGSVDMLTTVIVGNSRTRLVGGRMVTPRGYALERKAE